MNRHLYRGILALVVLCCVFFGSTACAETYASLAEKLGEGVGICFSCGGASKIEKDDTQHWSICLDENCSAYNYRHGEAHAASCVDSSVCGVCGAPTQPYGMSHVYDSMPLMSDAENHWYACALCGDDSFRMYHWRMCSDAACGSCGVAGNEYFTVYHNEDGIFVSEGEYHWQTCLTCGDVCDYSRHWGECAGDGKCYACSAVVTDPKDMFHEYDHSRLVPCPENADMHGYRCQNCTFVSEFMGHSPTCANLCMDCGAPCDGSGISHTLDYSQVVPNPVHAGRHGYPCTTDGCDYVSREYGHTQDCANPGVCMDCGAPYDGQYKQHDVGDAYESNGISHWQVCRTCSMIVYMEEHYIYCEGSVTRCEVCKRELENPDAVYHEHEWNDNWMSDAAYHWQVCAQCGNININSKMAHVQQCSAPGVCIECGAACEGRIEHWFNWEEQVFTKEGHGHACRDCGIVQITEQHFASCLEPNACRYCDYEGEGIEQEHPDFDEAHDVQTHWQFCMDCSITLHEGEHYALCSNPDICYECGYEAENMKTEHFFGYNQEGYKGNDEVHWQLCMYCGEEGESSAHEARCYEPGICYQCGYEDENIGYSHSSDEGTCYNDTHHWYLCLDCGKQMTKELHMRRCGSTVCADCGVVYAGDNVSHDLDYGECVPHPYDENYHGYACRREGCGYVEKSSIHRQACDNPGECADCGAACSGTNWIHTAETYSATEKCHWKECAACGFYAEMDGHVIECWMDLTACGVCGYEFSDTSDVLHYHISEDGFESDETHHWKVCPACGMVVEVYEHIQTCADPGVCVECGADCDDSKIQHNPDEEYITTPSEHSQICLDCGDIVSSNRHYAYCTDLQHCAECGAETTNFFEIWHQAGEFLSSESRHYIECRQCGITIQSDAHKARCYNPGICDYCGYADDDMAQGHLFDYNPGGYDNDETYHWAVCRFCDEADRKERHEAFCGELGVCAACGYESEDIEIIHNYSADDMDHDKNYHWYTCEGCSEMIRKKEHQRLCGSEICVDCGAAYTGDSILHHQSGEMGSDRYSHWKICSQCEGEMHKEDHEISCLNPNVCKECGAETMAWWEDNMHNPSGEFEYDAYHHWQICEDCGEITWYETHYTDCENPGICTGCENEVEIASVEHYTDEIIAIDATRHQGFCGGCGKVTWDEAHWVECGDESMTCVDCGFEGAAVVIIMHTGTDWDDTLYDDEQGHYRLCKDCGEKERAGDHIVDCVNPSVCYICGREADEDMEINHHPAGMISSDDTHHWYICMACDEKADVQAHEDKDLADGYCDWCAAPVGDMPPVIGLDSKTVYITSRNYGNVFEIYGYYTMREDDEGDVTVSSSDESVLKAEIVQINDDEYVIRVTGLKAGTATLTMTAPNGLTDTMEFKAVAAGNELVLPEETTVVKAQAFAGAAALEFVYIPYHVTEIGDEAFKDCANLKVVYIPVTVESIGKDAFKGCDDVIIQTAMSSPAYEYAVANGISCYGVPQE